MDIREYEKIYYELNHYEDVDRLAREQGYDKELLFVIFTEKHVRCIKRDFYRIKSQSRRLLEKWHRGHSFVTLAKELQFSPLMLAHMLLQEKGMTKKEIHAAMIDADAIRDARLRSEIAEATDHDLVYSEEGARVQRERGAEGEATIAKWLQAQGITYKTEKDLKGNEHGKTVDFLLDKPITIQFEDGPKDVCWIESKASFGDNKKMMRDYKKQLEPYTQFWGPGIVAYWFGYLDGMEMWLEPRNVKPVARDWFGDYGAQSFKDPNIPERMKSGR
jgi:hypothetical protein